MRIVAPFHGLGSKKKRSITPHEEVQYVFVQSTMPELGSHSGNNTDEKTPHGEKAAVRRLHNDEVQNKDQNRGHD